MDEDADIVAVAAAFKTINEADHELVAHCGGDLNPETFGVLIKQYLPIDAGRMTDAQKLFWLRVAGEIGPDWIAAFRKVGGFMNKVDEF